MRNHQEWEDLGRNIQQIVDKAVGQQDYQQLNQTIRQTVGKAVDLGSEVVRKAVDTTAQKVAQKEKAAVVDSKPPVLYGSTGRFSTKGILKIVGGSLLCCVMLGIAAVSGIVALVSDVSAAAPMLLSVAGFGGGAGLLGSGICNMSRLTRFRTYCKILGEKTCCTLEALASGVGKTEKFVRKELQGMIRDGLFLQGHLDNEQTRLITSHETFHQFEQSRLLLEQRQKQEKLLQEKKAGLSAQVLEILNKGDDFVDQIRRCNDAIPGALISEKICRIEHTVERIFDRVEEHPELVSDLKKLMDYYLPMTVKLLNAYAEMDAQTVQGETILAAKREIEDTLDTLNLAYEKLLDQLFEETALDISSDISVLNTLLAQEGLKDDELSKMKKTGR